MNLTRRAAAGSPQHIALRFVGRLGTPLCVPPGIGPIPTIALLLPITDGRDPLASLVEPSGIYHGAQYGRSTAPILVNLPGEASSIVTCIDGHQMANAGIRPRTPFGRGPAPGRPCQGRLAQRRGEPTRSSRPWTR